jgi:hypothetical protein
MKITFGYILVELVNRFILLYNYYFMKKCTIEICIFIYGSHFLKIIKYTMLKKFMSFSKFSPILRTVVLS